MRREICRDWNDQYAICCCTNGNAQKKKRIRHTYHRHLQMTTWLSKISKTSKTYKHMPWCAMQKSGGRLQKSPYDEFQMCGHKSFEAIAPATSSIKKQNKTHHAPYGHDFARKSTCRGWMSSCWRASQDGKADFAAMGLRYNKTENCKTFQQSKRFSPSRWSDCRRKYLPCILDCVEKVEVLKNISFRM